MIKKKAIWVLSTTFNGHVMLKALLDYGLKIDGVIGLDSSLHRSAEFFDSAEFCRQREIRHFAAPSYDLSTFSSFFKEKSVDFLLVLGWQRLVPHEIIGLVRDSCIGVHGSDLGISRGRGRSPQNWSIILGAGNFEVSIFHIDQGIDSGKVIDSASIKIQESDTVLSLHNKVAHATANMIFRFLTRPPDTLDPHDHSHQIIEYLPKRLPKDGIIDWTRSAKLVTSFIRGLTYPYPGAYSQIGGCKIHFWNAFEIPDLRTHVLAQPGRIVNHIPDLQITVECGQNFIVSSEFTISDLDFADLSDMILETSDFQNQMAQIRDRHLSKYPTLPIAKRILDFK